MHLAHFIIISSGWDMDDPEITYDHDIHDLILKIESKVILHVHMLHVHGEFQQVIFESCVREGRGFAQPL